ncbi:hypothetical protein IT084_06340 [Desulfallas sp. Bu1-1]|uniref:hypothetical protein n=1 Tax=Desulfallas sp. Bu1-1 TaxID=2787620 RepID=UPI00189EA59D|nr:hypothetical protein [Desulfallas sp. Bu1-1]MBF7082597.1 hypothetical protein [Desulfallas sp. Bu1-1]
MSLPGRSMLVSMGIYIGLIFVGINICLTHYNRLVAPDPPLRLFEWRVEGEKVEISLLGDSHTLQVHRDLPANLEERFGELLQIGQGEAFRWLDYVRQKAREMENRP